MQTLLWIGNPFFFHALQGILSDAFAATFSPEHAPEFAAAQSTAQSTVLWGQKNWKTIWHKPGPQELVTWQDCLRLAGGPPDIVVMGDTSRPPFVLGVESFPCPTVFYAVDTHIHSWMPWYGQAFDACLISLKDHMEMFRHKRLTEKQLWWSPPYTRHNLPVREQSRAFRPLPCVFVGTTNAQSMPLRHHFLTRLQKNMPRLRILFGGYPRYYSHARTVVNICEHGDLNFRVFESMGCGAALVTPAIGNGLTDIFTPNEHMLTFPLPLHKISPFSKSGDSPPATKGKQATEHPTEQGTKQAAEQGTEQDKAIHELACMAADSAAEQLHSLLDNEERRRALALAGYAKVRSAHLDYHRALALISHLNDLPPDLTEQRRKQAADIRKTCLRLPYLLWGESLPDPFWRTVYIQAARGELFS